MAIEEMQRPCNAFSYDYGMKSLQADVGQCVT